MTNNLELILKHDVKKRGAGWADQERSQVVESSQQFSGEQAITIGTVKDYQDYIENYEGPPEKQDEIGDIKDN